jgi:hypothetical protein
MGDVGAAARFCLLTRFVGVLDFRGEDLLMTLLFARVDRALGAMSGCIASRSRWRGDSHVLSDALLIYSPE